MLKELVLIFILLVVSLIAFAGAGSGVGIGNPKGTLNNSSNYVDRPNTVAPYTGKLSNNSMNTEKLISVPRVLKSAMRDGMNNRKNNVKFAPMRQERIINKSGKIIDRTSPV